MICKTCSALVSEGTPWGAHLHKQTRTDLAELVLCSSNGLFTQARTARSDCQPVYVHLPSALRWTYLSLQLASPLCSDAAGAQRRSACAANLSQQDITVNNTHTKSAWSAIGVWQAFTLGMFMLINQREHHPLTCSCYYGNEQEGMATEGSHTCIKFKYCNNPGSGSSVFRLYTIHLYYTINSSFIKCVVNRMFNNPPAGFLENLWFSCSFTDTIKVSPYFLYIVY